MSPEQKSALADVKKHFPNIIILATLAYISRWAFSEESRREIIERANGRCQNCNKRKGRFELFAAHFNHTKNKRYDSLENGRALCKTCEFKYHYLNHHSCIKVLGLSTEHNRHAIRGWFYKHSKKQRAKLLRQYGDELRKIVS